MTCLRTVLSDLCYISWNINTNVNNNVNTEEERFYQEGDCPALRKKLKPSATRTTVMFDIRTASLWN
jgi:hypothetical protein